MSKPRIYYYNKGDMLELVRTQKQENKQMARAEEMSASDIFISDKNKKGMLGKYAELMNCSIPYPQVKKIASIKGHLWGLVKACKIKYSRVITNLKHILGSLCLF